MRPDTASHLFPERPRGLAEFIEDTVAALGALYRQLLTVSGVLAVPAAVISAALCSVLWPLVSPAAVHLRSAAAAAAQPEVFLRAVLHSTVNEVLSIPAWAVSSAAMTLIIADRCSGRAPSISRSLRTGFTRLPVTIGALLLALAALIITAGSGLTAGGAVLGRAVSSSSGLLALAALAVFLVTLACTAAAAVILGLVCSLVPMCAAVEQTGVIGSLKRAWGIVRRRPWVLLALVLISYLASAVATSPAGALTWAVEQTSLPLSLAGIAAWGIGKTLALPLTIVPAALVFLDDRKRSGLAEEGDLRGPG